MPLNMCANCSAVTSLSMAAQSGSAESTLGIILGGTLLKIIGIVTMLGLFSPAILISRIVFSVIMILLIIPFVTKLVKKATSVAPDGVFNKVLCRFPEQRLSKKV